MGKGVGGGGCATKLDKQGWVREWGGVVPLNWTILGG